MCLLRRRKTNDVSESDGHRYEMALQLLSYEGQIAWQMNILFIALNVGIGAVLQNRIEEVPKYCIFVGVVSLIGFVVNIAWLGTFRRNNKYYHFRMAQAREAEPEGWNLLRNRGYRFSKGNEIEINDSEIESPDRKHKLSSFEKWASNKRAIGVAIWTFIISFAILAGLSARELIIQKCDCSSVQPTNSSSNK